MYLVWKQQVVEGGVITAGDFDVADSGIVPASYRDVLCGMHTAYSTGAGEKVAWQDFIMSEEEIAQVNDA